MATNYPEKMPIPDEPPPPYAAPAQYTPASGQPYTSISTPLNYGQPQPTDPGYAMGPSSGAAGYPGGYSGGSHMPPPPGGGPGYYGPAGTPGTPGTPGAIGQTIIVAQHPSYNLRASPAHLLCPHCHEHIVTRVEQEIGLMAWLSCLGIMVSAFFVGFTILCCWIPFCIPECNDVSHSCPNCGKFIGKFKRMGA